MRCGQCDRFVPSSGDLVTRNTGHWAACLQTVWSPRSLVTGHCQGMLSLLSPGDTWAVLSLSLPPDIPLQCLRHQVNGLMVSPAWRLSHAPPIPPVNNFNQIHYPDKSVINCHILHIIFPEFVKESQTMSRSEKQR